MSTEPQASTTPETDDPNALLNALPDDAMPESDDAGTAVVAAQDAHTDNEASQLPAGEDLEDEPFAQAAYAHDDDYDLMGSGADIDAALAAVASLSDIAAEREASEDAKAAARRPARTAPAFLPPPPVKLRRGAAASVFPALILIGSGTLLTITTTSGQAIPLEWVALAALGALALLFLGYWLTARRWARGTFFFAVLLLLSAAALYAITLPNGPGANGLPLLMVATGGALVLTAIATRPATRRALVPGMLMILAGLAVLTITLGVFTLPSLDVFAQYGWVLAVVMGVIWVLPFVFRRRD